MGEKHAYFINRGLIAQILKSEEPSPGLSSSEESSPSTVYYTYKIQRSQSRTTCLIGPISV